METVSLQSLDSEPNLIIGHPQGSQNVFQDLQIRSTRDTGDAGRLHGQAQKTHGSPIGVCEVVLPSWEAKLAAISLKEKSSPHLKNSTRQTYRRFHALLKASMHLKNPAVKAWKNPAIANISPTIMSFHFHPPSPNSEEPTFFDAFPHFTYSRCRCQRDSSGGLCANHNSTLTCLLPKQLQRFVRIFLFHLRLPCTH